MHYVYIGGALLVLIPVLYLAFTYGIWFWLTLVLVAMWFIYFRYNKNPQI